MRRSRALVVFFSMMFFIFSGQDALGVGRGWLERLSGPGPFVGWETPTLPIFCWDDEKDFKEACAVDAWKTDFVSDAERMRPTDHNGWVFLTFTYSHLESQENQLEYEQVLDEKQKQVTLQAFQFSLDYRVAPALDIGIGMGINKFSGDAFGNLWRGSFDPIRVVWRPVAFFVKNPTRKIAGRVRLSLREIVQVKFRATHFIGGFEDIDFGAKPETFKDEAELVFGWSVTLGIILAF